MKRKTRRIIRNRKKEYDSKKKETILSGGANKFHNCVKAFLNIDKKGDWSPRALYSLQAKQAETAEKMAEYFNNISNEYQPLDPTQIPS